MTGSDHNISGSQPQFVKKLESRTTIQYNINKLFTQY